MAVTAKQIEETFKTLNQAEGWSRAYGFVLPEVTEFYDSYYIPEKTDKSMLKILDTPAKITTACYSSYDPKGITTWVKAESHKKGAEKGTPSRWGTPNTRLAMSWDDMVRQPKVLEAVTAWIEKVTPNYTVKKDKGVIEFTNNKTDEKLFCDLGKQTFTRTYKKGKPKQIRYPMQFFKYVSGRLLATQVAESDPDCKNFQTLVGLVSKKYSKCRNFGTFLVRMFDHIHLEPYIAAGVEFDFEIPFLYQNFGKDIRAKLNAEKIRYDNNVGSLFCSDLDVGRAVFAQIKDKVGFGQMVRILAQNIQPMNTLVNHYNYDLKTLFAYCRKKQWRSDRPVPTYNYYYNRQTKKIDPENELVEGGDRYFSTYGYDCIQVLRDYARMAVDVYGDNYDKYPENLHTAHDEVMRVYKTRQQEIDAKKFVDMIDPKLEWKSKDYVVLYPKTPDEITEEGKKLRHCVGGYIQSVVRGECTIVFLRRKDEKDKPLITIEISGGNIRQARGYGNCAPKYDEKQALKDYAKEKKLLYN
jgi:hypothetical protein